MSVSFINQAFIENTQLGIHFPNTLLTQICATNADVNFSVGKYTAPSYCSPAACHMFTAMIISFYLCHLITIYNTDLTEMLHKPPDTLRRSIWYSDMLIIVRCWNDHAESTTGSTKISDFNLSDHWGTPIALSYDAMFRRGWNFACQGHNRLAP